MGLSVESSTGPQLLFHSTELIVRLRFEPRPRKTRRAARPKAETIPRIFPPWSACIN